MVESTVFPRSNAAATIFFIIQVVAATIRGWRLLSITYVIIDWNRLAASVVALFSAFYSFLLKSCIVGSLLGHRQRRHDQPIEANQSIS